MATNEQILNLADSINPEWRNKSRRNYVYFLRNLVIRELRKQDYTLTTIGEIVDLHHSTITHWLKTEIEDKYLNPMEKRYLRLWNAGMDKINNKPTLSVEAMQEVISLMASLGVKELSFKHTRTGNIKINY